MKETFQLLEQLCLMDDDFMTVVFSDQPEAAGLLLRIILGQPDLFVTEVTTQKEIRNLYGRSVRLDIEAADSHGRRFNVEVQRSERGAVPQRARYHSSIMDTRLLRPGQDYSELADTYVIFITESDVMGESLPVYHVKRRIRETGADFADGSHILYVNGMYKGKDEIGDLMHDFHCTRAEDMRYPILAERVRYLKESEGGRETMSGALAEWKAEWKREVAKELEAEIKRQVTAEITKEVTAAVTAEVTREVTKEVTRAVTAEVTAEVTKQVTAEGTEQVTAEVTAEVTEQVTAEVTKEVKTEHALRMLEDGVFSLDKIAKYTDLPLEQVKALAEQRNT